MKIAIASGKGGTGKTLVSTNLFNTIRKLGRTVTLVDCDAEEPNANQFIRGKHMDEQLIVQKVPIIDLQKCTFCNKCQEYCNYNAIMVFPQINSIQVIEDLCHDCGACYYACKYSAITGKDKTIGTISNYELDNTSTLIEGRIDIGVYSSVPIIKKTINALSDNQISILDAPPGTSCPFIATVEDADYVILVTEPTPFGLNDLKLSISTLKELNKPFGVIINRDKIGNDDTLKYLKQNQIPILAKIPFDKKVAKIYSEGKLITDVSPAFHEIFKQLYLSIQKLN